MDQNSGLKAPKKLACLLVKKCGNNGQELGNFKLITLYTERCGFLHYILRIRVITLLSKMVGKVETKGQYFYYYSIVLGPMAKVGANCLIPKFGPVSN